MRRVKRPAATSLGEKTALVVLGLCLGLILLELALRTAGGALSILAERSRISSPDGGGPRSLTLLCLGESTTAPTFPDDSWPRQLERELAGAGGTRFRIVNAGVVGTNSMEVSARLPKLLADHAPDAVVAMVGINDSQWFGVPRPVGGVERRLSGLKIYKALKFFKHGLSGPAPLKEAEPETTLHRDLLVRGIRERRLPLILMQYPGLDVRTLEAHFDDPGILFVANKPSFDEALRRGNYDELFKDHFGGSWGHCTAEGNRLIALNAAAGVRRLIALGRFEKAPVLSRDDELAIADWNLRAAEEGASIAERPAALRAGVRLHLRSGDGPGAEALARKSLEAYPDDLDSLRLLVELDAAKPEEARAFLERSAAAARRLPFERRGKVLAECLRLTRRRGDLAETRRELERALKASPVDAAFVEMTGNLTAKSIRDLERAATHSSPEERFEIDRACARAWLGLGNENRAKALLTKVLERRPDDLEALRLMLPLTEPKSQQQRSLLPADVCFDVVGGVDRNRLDLPFFDDCVREFPKSGRLLVDRGVARYLKGDLTGARADFEAALQIRPDFWEASTSLAALLADRGDPRKARQVAAAAAKKKIPRSPSADTQRGRRSRPGAGP